MWRMFKELWIYGDPDGDIRRERPDASTLPLDRITCAGTIDITALRRGVSKDKRRSFTIPRFVCNRRPDGIEMKDIPGGPLLFEHTAPK